jgi:hypothetical protein
MLGRDSAKAARGKLDANVLVAAVVVGLASRTRLRKDDATRRSAIGAAQYLGPLVPLGHAELWVAAIE